MASPPTLAEVVDRLHAWYPPETAEDWDAVGLILGRPADQVRRIAFAVDPVLPVAQEAVAWGADLLVVHHPLFLRPVHGVPATTPKGRTLDALATGGCALLAAHTNADQALEGVSEAMAVALGLTELSPLVPGSSPETGTGRQGLVVPTSLADFARQVAAVLPATAQGVRVAGPPDRPVQRVALCGGAGDGLLDLVGDTDADVYVTSDLRHHPASEFCEREGPALIDVAHWAAEWTWLPVVADRVRRQWGDRVETHVSTICTDPWQFRVGQDAPGQDAAEESR